MKKSPPSLDEIYDLNFKTRYSLYLNKRNMDQLLIRSPPKSHLSNIVDSIITNYLNELDKKEARRKGTTKGKWHIRVLIGFACQKYKHFLSAEVLFPFLYRSDTVEQL